jgi:hypothetical protein
MQFEQVPLEECIRGRSVSGAWADYDQDDDPDLYVTGMSSAMSAARSCLYRNRGDGTFAIVSEGPVVEDAAASGIASWGDYDNDCLPDLFVGTCDFTSGSGANNNNRLYRNLGQGRFERILEGDIVNDGLHAVFGAAWGDYDNDGDLDLFVPNGNEFYPLEGNGLYENQGGTNFHRVMSGSLANDGPSWGAAWGDYDNDGFLDLFVVSSVGENLFYRNNGNSNHWINIRCIGTAANRAGIGAKVFVTATIRGKQVRQMREISSGCGAPGTGFTGAHFGLGDATIIDTIRIEWPGPKWTKQELHNVPAGKPGDKPLKIIEPAEGPRLTAEWAGALRLTLQGEVGVSYALEASPDLGTWSVLETLTVTNPNGTITYSDAESPRLGQRFYRAVKQP